MNFSAALIAGGRSTRMGTDKAQLDWQGQPLWRHQWVTLQRCGAEVTVVCARKGQEFPGVRVLLDETEDLGPLSGLLRALETSAQPLVLVLAADLPQMTATFLRGRLLASVRDEIGVVPRLEGFYEPLAAIYPVRMAEEVRRRLQAEDRSLQSLCRWAEQNGLIRSVEVAPSERGLFRNLNRPQD